MEFFTIAFSTFLGAAVALAADRLTRRRDAKHYEEAAINNLVLDLAAKRAFLAGPDWVWVDGELARVIDSLFHARSLVRETRMQLRPRSRALQPLRRMTQALNRFLELSDREDDGQLMSALRQLTTDMSNEVHALHRLNPRRICSDAPGSAALPTSHLAGNGR